MKLGVQEKVKTVAYVVACLYLFSRFKKRGNMARTNRKNKKNGTRSKTKPGYSYVAFCPIDGLPVSVLLKDHFATCKEKHRFQLR